MSTLELIAKICAQGVDSPVARDCVVELVGLCRRNVQMALVLQS
jgi:hypothetical protein